MISFAPLVRYRWGIVLAFGVLVAWAVPELRGLQQDNSPEAYFLDDAAALERYRDLEFRFGRDRHLRIVVEGETLWTPAGLDWLARVEREAESLRGVLGAGGLFAHHGWRFDAWPPPSASRFRAEVVADPIDRATGWVSAEGETVSILVALYALPQSELHATLEELAALLEDAPAGVDTTLIGLPVVERALDASLLDFATRFLPALASVSLLALLVFLGPTVEMAAVLALVGVVLTVVFGAFARAGETVDIVVIVLVPLLLVVTLATGVHVVVCFRRLRVELEDPGLAIERTLRLKSWPVIWTGATTAVGFGSLAVSPAPPVRTLGEWAAFGLAFSTLATLGLLPALLAIGCRRGEAGHALGFARGLAVAETTVAWGRRLALAAARRRRAVLLIFASSGLAALAAAGLLRVETNILSYFTPRDPVRLAIERLEERGVGAAAASLVLRAPAGVSFREPAGLRLLHALGERLRSEPGLLGVVTAGDLVREVGSWPQRREPPAEPLELGLRRIAAEAELRRLLDLLVTPDGDLARIVVQVPMQGPLELEPRFARLVATAREVVAGSDAWVSGRYPLVLAAQRGILRTMLAALALTGACVVLAFRVVTRSWALAGRALLPNLWPVMVVLGVMGAVRVPVDSTTVMIASAVLGLAVDDTLHTLGWVRVLAARRDAVGVAAAALERSAGAHGATTALLVAGLGVCAFSAFLPIARFGAVSQRPKKSPCARTAIGAALRIVRVSPSPSLQSERIRRSSSRQACGMELPERIAGSGRSGAIPTWCGLGSKTAVLEISTQWRAPSSRALWASSSASPTSGRASRRRTSFGTTTTCVGDAATRRASVSGAPESIASVAPSTCGATSSPRR